MNPTDSQEQFVDDFNEIDLDSTTSIDDFIRELEEKEKDLHITATDMVVEIEEYEADGGANEIVDFDKLFQTGKENINSPAVSSPQKDEELQKANRELAEFRVKVRQLEKERDEMREVFSRRQNDFENYRKRTEREKSETMRGLIGDLAGKMLPVVDNLSRAIDSVNELAGEKSSDFHHFLDGIVLVSRQLNEVLAEMGVEPILAVGEPFDPHLHEAVATEKNESLAPNTVTAEFLRGYRLDDKVIRHAMVQVSAGGNAGLNTEESEGLDEDFSDLEIE